MALRQNTVTVAIYVIFALLWMVLFINTSEQEIDKNKNNNTKRRHSILNPSIHTSPSSTRHSILHPKPLINTSEQEIDKIKNNKTKARHSILNPKTSILTSPSSTRHSILNPKPSIHTSPSTILTSKPCLLNSQPLIINNDFSSQSSILNPSELDNVTIPDLGSIITPKFKQPEDEPRMFWFDNLEQSDKDNSVQLLSQGIQHYNGLHQNVLLDMEAKFGITFSQSQELYEYLYLKENQESMDWFDDPYYPDKDVTFQLVKQRMEHYERVNEDVVNDMKLKFGIIASITQALYKILYCEQKKMSHSRKDVQSQIVEKSGSNTKTEFENDTVLNKGNGTEDIDFNPLELNQIDGKARTVPLFPTNYSEPKRNMEYLLIEVSEEQDMELNLFSEYFKDVVDEFPGKDDDGYCHTTYSENSISIDYQNKNAMCLTCVHYDLCEATFEHGADAVPLDRIDRDTKRHGKKMGERLATRHSIRMTILIDIVNKKSDVTPPVVGSRKRMENSDIQFKKAMPNDEDCDRKSIWEQYVVSHNKRDVEYVLSAANYLKINCLSQLMGPKIAQDIQNTSRKEDVFALLAGETLVHEFFKK